MSSQKHTIQKIVPKPIIKKSQFGRVRPLVIALVLIAVGLILDKWWWQIGLTILVVLFVEAFYRYRSLG